MESENQFIRTWAPAIVATVALAINAAGGVYLFGKFEARLEKVEEHSVDQSVHMPYRDKVKEFVPRSEYESDQRATKREMDQVLIHLERIENKLDVLAERE